MQPVRVIFGLAFLTLSWCASVSAQQRSIQMLTPRVGWAFLGGRLFWTTDAGGQWKDITPATALREGIASIRFSDTSTGWVLLAGDDGDEPRFDLASTTNAGERWSITPVRLPRLSPGSLVGQGHLYFLDSLHGWMNLSLQSSAAVHSGVLFVTQDGGSTWDWAPQRYYSAGPIRFISAQDGWIVSPEGDELYVTHDGARSWRALSLEAPPQVPRPVRATYALPTFEDGKRGFLLVSYLGPASPTSTLVLFASDDGGQTWKLDRALPGLEPRSFMPPSTVGQSNLVTATVSDHRLTLTTVASGNKTSATIGTPSSTSADVGNVAGVSVVSELSFVDSMRGWVLTSESSCSTYTFGCHQLLATTDGGRTWAEITPPKAKRTHPTVPGGVKAPWPGAPVESKPPPEGAGLAGPQIASAARVSIHLGFDIGFVPTTQQMQTWWNSSPFWDTSVYLPSPNHLPDPLLDAAWVTAVRTQGWGLIPIWVGLQAPCNTRPLSKFSSDPLSWLYQHTAACTELSLLSSRGAHAMGFALSLPRTTQFRPAPRLEVSPDRVFVP